METTKDFDRIMILDYVGSRTLEIMVGNRKTIDEYDDIEEFIREDICPEYGLSYDDIYWMTTDKPVDTF